MFKDNTVFIIGAGASREFNFPVGAALMDIIRKKSHFRFEHSLKEGDRVLFRWLQQRYDSVDDQDARLTALAEIDRAIDSAGSIDEFIARNSHNPLIAEMGKVQIAYAIAQAEADSQVMRDGDRHSRTVNFSALKETWIDSFVYAMFNGVRTVDVNTLGDNISIICFNYDRCIEFYLANSIHQSFEGVTLEQAGEIVNRMNIIHPYGTLGKLPEGPNRIANDSVPFGLQLDMHRVWSISENILTFSESLRDLEINARIDAAMFEAQRLVFMGFSFARQNMDLLANKSFDPSRSFNRQAYATAYGYKTQVVESLKSNISNLYAGATLDPKHVHLDIDLTCKDFMKTHLLNLMD